MSFLQAFKKQSVEAVIAALGNPGREYARSRHNAGFLCADQILADAGVSLSRAKFSALIAPLSLGGHRVLLLLPQTFMNRSGESVHEAMSFYKLPPEKLIVLTDDIHLPCGMIRVRESGSDGGHNGLKNIIQHLHSNAFTRIRIGVGEPESPDRQVDYVIGEFSKAEEKQISAVFPSVQNAVRLILDGKTQEAMNLYNRKAPHDQ